MTLPTVHDFTCSEPPEADLDGYSAWTRFGGLSLAEAHAKLCECPEVYQEDFMWMGDRAFVYYFPVVDRYLRTVEASQELDQAAWIFAHAIAIHVRTEPTPVNALHDRIEQLCSFVLAELARIPDRPERTHSVAEVAVAWTGLRDRLG